MLKSSGTWVHSVPHFLPGIVHHYFHLLSNSFLFVIPSQLPHRISSYSNNIFIIHTNKIILTPLSQGSILLRLLFETGTLLFPHLLVFVPVI